MDRTAIAEAAERVAPHIRRTPVADIEAGLFGLAEPVVAKLELLQHTGSFKPRGAFNRTLQAAEAGAIPDAGVIAASGGNHGMAVAYAARSLGTAAEIFVPEVAPEIKVAKLRKFGATVNIVEGIYDNAYTACAARAEETGALLVHPFNQPDVITGQATMALEIEEQVPDVDTVLVSSGGGGLAAGAAAWFGADTKVVAVEPETSSCFASALEAGEPVRVKASGVAVDSLGAGIVGALAFDTLVAQGAQSVLVTDAAIETTQRLLWDQLRLVVEPGGAAAAAALQSGVYVPEAGERVVVVICGSNTDPNNVI